MMTTNDQLYAQFKDLLEANLDPIRIEIKSINKALNGNGQAGLIQRVGKLEDWRWYVIGAIATIIFMITFFGEEIKSIIFR
jgi:phage-related protein